MIDHINAYVENKTKLRDQLNQIWYVLNTKQDNDVIDHIGLVYAKTETELARSIWLSAIYDENQIEQQCDRS